MKVIARVAKLGDLQGNLLLLFFDLFPYRLELFSNLFVELDSIDDPLCDLWIFMEQV